MKSEDFHLPFFSFVILLFSFANYFIHFFPLKELILDKNSKWLEPLCLKVFRFSVSIIFTTAASGRMHQVQRPKFPVQTVDHTLDIYSANRYGM